MNGGVPPGVRFFESDNFSRPGDVKRSRAPKDSHACWAPKSDVDASKWMEEHFEFGKKVTYPTRHAWWPDLVAAAETRGDLGCWGAYDGFAPYDPVLGWEAPHVAFNGILVYEVVRGCGTPCAATMAVLPTGPLHIEGPVGRGVVAPCYFWEWMDAHPVFRFCPDELVDGHRRETYDSLTADPNDSGCGYVGLEEYDIVLGAIIESCKSEDEEEVGA